MVMIPGMCRYVAQDAQIIVIQIDFRFGPEHPTPAQVEDCTSAYKWVSTSKLWSRRLLFSPAVVALTPCSAIQMPPSLTAIRTDSSPSVLRLVEA